MWARGQRRRHLPQCDGFIGGATGDIWGLMAEATLPLFAEHMSGTRSTSVVFLRLLRSTGVKKCPKSAILVSRMKDEER